MCETLFEKEMNNPEFKEMFEQARRELDLEIQFFEALKKKNLTYEDFAKKLGTSRSNICRDLKGKGIQKASLNRIKKMAEILDMDLVIKLVPKEQMV
ncbi:MAG TPA: helix-turn-helix transcriptional regulator [Candidatus Eremiobacteraeota bacterium]|nr:helix-turn-helix transcriptional regulator [Candidatus Eremiobacteraeota bacterium]